MSQSYGILLSHLLEAKLPKVCLSKILSPKATATNWLMVQLRCNFTLAREQFTCTLKQFTQTHTELLVACAFITHEELTQLRFPPF